MKRINDVRTLGKEDLSKRLNELYKELSKKRAQASTGTNPGGIKKVRKTIARIKMCLASPKNKEE